VGTDYPARSFLFNRSVLVTGEVPRTTGYEAGFPPQQAWLGGRWQPDPSWADSISTGRLRAPHPLVLDDLGAIAPSVVVPAHCTGWRAQHAMGARFGEAFIPNTVGTRFEL
jgi:7,8-dihydropterin-6-yl-methyl-4-(beta-D-ribofuranosyl)aminobenzene 5'-phosphate synthase